MKKISEKILAVLTVSLMLSTVLLPVAVSAQENISSSLGEVISEKSKTTDAESGMETNEYEATEPLEYLFKEQLSNQDILEQEDLAFLNNITVQTIKGELFLSFEETENDYHVSINTYESDYEIIADKLEYEQIKFYNLHKNSIITIKIQNSKSKSENVVAIRMNSDKLEISNQDLLVTINPETEVDPETENIVEFKMSRSMLAKIYDEFLTKKKVNYYATVLQNNEGIYTKPNGMQGAILYTSYKYNNKDVKVGEEATTANGTFVKLVGVEDNGTIGWIKKSSIKIKDRILSQKSTSYRAKVKATNDGIYTQPKGMQGAVLYTNYLYNNKTVQVIEEATTESGVFAKIARIEDGIVLGWINKKSLNTEKIVFLDAGHGGTDGGATYFGVNEKTINLKVTNKVKNSLEALGFTVVMIRETDKTVGLLERSMAANLSGADIFVSIHHNAMPSNSTVTGIETYYYQYDPDYPSKMNQQYHNDPARILESSKLATNIHSSLINSTGAKNRGVKRNTFSVLRETAIPAVLLELGYMSSPTELAKLNTDSYQNTLAKAITNGIVAYFK